MQVRYQLRHRPRCRPVEAPDNSISLQHGEPMQKIVQIPGAATAGGSGSSIGIVGQSFQSRSSA